MLTVLFTITVVALLATVVSLIVFMGLTVPVVANGGSVDPRHIRIAGYALGTVLVVSGVLFLAAVIGATA